MVLRNEHFMTTLKLHPVESSHIAAIGYLEEERVLLVRFKDGSLYGRPKVEPHEWDELSKAHSKGVWLKRYADMIRISDFVGHGSRREKEAANLVPEPGRGPESSGEATGPLNVLDPDADKCCVKSFAGAVLTLPSFSCPSCGTEFRAEMVGPVRSWRIKPAVLVFR